MFRHLFYVILISEVVSIPLLLSPVFREVGQDVVFMVNITNILTFNWGIRDGNTEYLKQGFIRYDKRISDAIKLDGKLNSSSYAGRVSFVGDVTKGHAWFKITNLNINDTNQYMVKMYMAAGYQYLSVKLTVVQPRITTIQPPSTSLTPTSLISQSLTTVPATVNPPTLKNLTVRLKVDEKFSEEMKNINSSSFQDFAKRFGHVIKVAYESNTNFKSVRVISLRKGSIDVTFVIFFESEIKLDEACDPLESAIEGGKLGNFKLVRGSLRCNKVNPATPSPATSPSAGVHPGIIAGVVIVGILAIVGLVIAIIFVFRKKASQKAYRNSTRGEPYAMERRQGEPEEQYASVQRPGASGEQVLDDNDQPLPQYAAVDKSKKMKNRDPNELVYATLDHDYNQSMGARSSSDRRTTGGSDTVYADIQKNQQKNQQQRHPPPQYGNLQPTDYA